MTRITDHLDEDESSDRQFVSALARGLDILGCFRASDRYLSNHEIAARTGLAKPTVSRLTYTLTRTGHLRRDDSSGEYRLGAQVLQLGFSALAATDLSDRAGPDMDRLANGPNPYVTIALAERSRNRAIYLAVKRSQQAVALSLNVGARLPLFYSAIGRAIIASMDEAGREEALAEAIAEFPEQRERMEHSLRTLLQDYETYGYCTGFGDWRAEITGIAAPLRSLDGTSVYGLNVGGPSFLVTPEELHRDYGPALLKAVERLGGTGSRQAM
ncbi:IclR family transcriptional regulator [Paracoccus onubensis]|uniref:IclR family transcriptional regulator n=1 Tax=Paracoccus onubensis TaxID=1675788 RepID=UPI00272F9344|nr:IclR family transcriptional regulator [Paracoccus onubensis]MDP0927341.1 IclR family transcriptional regulator [Paracoccus onubensis]